MALAAISMSALTRTLGRAARGLPTAIGAGPAEIRTVATGSSRFDGRSFSNPEPSHVLSLRDGLRLIPAMARRGGNGRPPMTIPLVTAPPAAVAGDLAVTWLGHATTLVEIDGRFVLTDPVWSRRVSPSTTVGPARLHPMPIGIGQLPTLTAVVISHDHYDHLDLTTVRQLVATQPAPFLVPVGVGAHLRRWGVPEDRIVELDWHDHVTVDGIEIVCTPGRHFSGRGLRRNTTLWSSWALIGPGHRVYFGGDTVDAVTCVLAIQDLAQRYSWFAPSVRDIRMLRIEVEVGAAVLQHDARLARDDCRAEKPVEALDERHRVAVLVDDGDVDRVARERAVRRHLVPGQRLHRIDDGPARVGMRLRDHPRDRHI